MSGYVILLFDVTEERQQFEHMQRLKEEADKANHAKSDFLAHVSHEVRTPINAVLGMNEMILRESQETETKKYALDIKNAARTLLSIINDILDSSKIESGKMMLLSNAVKYTQEGVVSLKITGITQEKQELLKVEVRDTGIGIQKEDLPHLFAAFERVDIDRNRNIEGTGLGMSIVVRLLKMMDSTLLVDSVYGEGTVFSFELSQKIVSTDTIGNFKQYQQQSTSQKNYEVSFIAPEAKVLVVDDNKINRVVFKNLLKQTQVKIEEADCGQACLDIVAKEHFDVIFMDDMMPGMNGRETLQHMKDLEKNACQGVPVIMLTANAVLGEKEKYLGLGFNDFLTKPIDPEKLEALLGRELPPKCIRWSVAELPNEEIDLAEKTDLPEITGVDWAYARLHLPEEKLLKETAISFWESISQEIDNLQSLIDCVSEEKYLTEYRIRVHTIKSTAAMLGIISIAGVAGLSEAAAKDKNVERLQVLHSVLMDELVRYQERLQILCTSDIPKETAELLEILPLVDMLRLAMQERDFDAADALIDKITSYSYDEGLQVQIDELHSQVMNLESEKAIVTAEKIIKEINKK